MNEKKIYLAILVIYALYINPIIIGGYEIIFYALIYGSALAYIILNFRHISVYLRKLPLQTAVLIFWIIVALTLSVIVPSLHGTYDFSYINVILAIFRKALILAFLFILTGKKHGREALIEHFMYYYALASVLYILSTMIFALSPSLRSMWQSLLHMNAFTQNLLTSFGYANRFGWAGFAGFRNTIDCTVSLIFLIYLFASKESKLRIKTFPFVILALMCFLGNMFYGRSGVIASVICLIVGLVLYKKITPKIILGILVVGFVGLLSINFLKARIPALNDWYIWLTTPFYNLVTTGSFNNYSADRLLNDMIFMPEGHTLLFGDGRYVDPVTGSYYMRTDSGFMRQILFWGAGITGIMYAFWLYSLSTIKRDFPIKIMLLIMCVLFEIKGEVYFEMLPLFLIIALIDYSNLKEVARRKVEV